MPEEKKLERTSTGRRGTCTNCERHNISIKNAKGHCSSCALAVAGIDEDSPEYSGILAAAREKYKNRTLPDKTHRSNGSEKDILQVLLDRRHELMNEVLEINKAISTIEKYSKAA